MVQMRSAANTRRKLLRRRVCGRLEEPEGWPQVDQRESARGDARLW